MTEIERLVGVDRVAPEHLLRRLRVIDPTAELIHIGEGRWMLGRILSDERIRQAGQRQARSAREAIRGRKPNVIDKRRHIVAQLRLLGFQPTSEFFVKGEPTARILREQELMQFLWSRANRYSLERMADAEQNERKAKADAELQDEALHRDAFNYLTRMTHSVTRYGHPLGTPSGRTRHVTQGAAS